MDLIPAKIKTFPESGQIIYSELAVAEFPKTQRISYSRNWLQTQKKSELYRSNK